MMRKVKFLPGAMCLPILAACNRHQSTLAPFGEEADKVRSIAIVLVVGSVILAAGLALLMRHAMRAPEGRLTHKGGMKLVLWLGVRATLRPAGPFRCGRANRRGI